MITKKFLAIILLTCFLASCKKVVDVKPQYILDGQELNSIQDFEFALTGAYAAFQNIKLLRRNRCGVECFCYPA